MRIAKWLLLPFLGAGLAMLANSGVRAVRTAHFVSTATRTSGTVTEVVTEFLSSTRRNYKPVFTFIDAAGVRHTAVSRIRSQPATHRVGETIEVLYDPADPSHAEPNGTELWAATSIMAAVGISFTALSTLGYLGLARQDRLEKRRRQMLVTNYLSGPSKPSYLLPSIAASSNPLPETHPCQNKCPPGAPGG